MKSGRLTDMEPFGRYFGVPKQTEVLILTLMGITCTIFDASLLDLNSNLHKVWQIALDSTRVSGSAQIYIKYLLSGIILVRTFLVHLYLAFYIVMLWPAIFEERPALLLPWLMVGAIKCLGMGMMSFFTGVFTCISYGVYRPACADFVLAQVVDHIPSFYMWFCVLSYYRELKATSIVSCGMTKSEFESQLIVRRRRVRSLADHNVMPTSLQYHQMIDEDRHLISVSTIENIVQQLTTDLHRKTTRSLDSLLSVMAAEAEKEEIMSLGDEGPSEEVGLTIQEKTAKLLKLTEADIIEAKRKKKRMLFTESMLSIEGDFDKLNPDERSINILRPTDTVPVPTFTENNLRPTKSEDNDIRKFDLSKPNTITTFMRDVSETEIGSILNYSTTSIVTTIDEEDVRSLIEEAILPHIEGQSVHPTDFQVSSALKVVVDDKEVPTRDVAPKEPNIINKVNVRAEKQTSDFECQASTLSRSVLKSFKPNLGQCGGNPSRRASASPRTPLTKPTKNDNYKCNNNILSTNMKDIKRSGLKEIEEIMPVKSELPKTASSFRFDGYTLAYHERMMMMKTRNRSKTKISVREEKEVEEETVEVKN